jgi:hypothetical protein
MVSSFLGLLNATAHLVAIHYYGLIAPSRFGYLGSPLPTNLETAMHADAYAELLHRWSPPNPRGPQPPAQRQPVVYDP